MTSMKCENCSWPDELLHGIDELPKLGAPGEILVFGAHAHAVLVTSGDVIMAAAEVGAGRLVVMSHEAYLKGFIDGKVESESVKQLHINIRKWVSRSTYLHKDHAAYASDNKYDVPVVVCRGGDSSREAKISSYVSNGGGLVYGLCPWGWMQVRKTKSSGDIPMQKLLESAGMTLTNKVAKFQGKHFDVIEQKTQMNHVCMANMDMLCKQCLSNPELETEYGKHLPNMVTGTPAMILHMMKDNLESLHSKYRDQLEGCAPSKQHKVTDTHDLHLINLYSALAHRGIGCSKLPGIEHFPGDFPPGDVLPLKCAELNITSEHCEVHPLGLYLPAGTESSMHILQSTPTSGTFEVIVGAHRDNLSNKSELIRWPVLTSTTQLTSSHTALTSPVGGQLYLRCPEQSEITLRLGNVVESPLFILDDERSCDMWTSRRQAPGLWADIVGRHIRFTFPSGTIRELDDPSAALETWDTLLEAYHELRGTDVNTHKKVFKIMHIN